jgi:diaminohydroxyphosphoribosylaminopyrimidine deaminase/5-amino-6-(5-phosphoribosylamino)uracil reductase
VSTGRPTVTLKIATSLDGRTALASGESQWLTGEAARARGQALRATSDAVLVGAGTLAADNPRLTVRLPGATRQPLRVVAGRSVWLKPGEHALADVHTAPTLVLTGRRASAEAVASMRAAGIAVARVVAARGGAGLDPAGILAAVTAHLGKPDAKVMLEGGARLAGAFMAADLIDRIEWHFGAVVMGSRGRPALLWGGPERLADAPRWELEETETAGPDVIARYARRR